ncbi:restriction endonuclease subunit S [Pseudomonas saliphila]|uniref:restriction endonuclease subunit S n=1 Tax=Pseudomonas saliphila TaxID=2586906 RepID=UPI0015B5A0A0|nr:restriction endonuclease subunit S [Pseudomonas saliphila]
MSEVRFPIKPLSDLVTAIRDGTHGTHRRVTEGVPLLSAKNITANGEIAIDETDDLISEAEYQDLTRSFQLEPNDLLLTIVGSLGRRAIYSGQRVTFQRSVAYIRPQQRKIGSRFLFHWMGHPWFSAELARRSNATAQAGLYLGELAKVSVPVPDVPEQSKIAQILDTLDTAIRETEALISKLKSVKQGLLHDLLTRGIDANGQLRPPQSEAPQFYKESPLGWIPREWDALPLDTVAVRGSGHTPSKNVSSYWNGGIKWVSLADSHRLDKIYIYETDKEISELGIANSSAVLHPGGTVILSRDAGIGKSAILGCEMAVSQHFMAWRCGEGLNNLFLYFYLQREKPKFEAIAMGSTIKTIGLPFFKGYKIAAPSRQEQDRAASILMEAELSLAAHDAELEKLRQQKSGLMDDLLTGRVRVTLLLESLQQASTPIVQQPAAQTEA